jgi:hypothetical protein
MFNKLEECKKYKIAGTSAIAQGLAINLFKLESEAFRVIDNRRLQPIQNTHLQYKQCK